MDFVCCSPESSDELLCFVFLRHLQLSVSYTVAEDDDVFGPSVVHLPVLQSISGWARDSTPYFLTLKSTLHSVWFIRVNADCLTSWILKQTLFWARPLTSDPIKIRALKPRLSVVDWPSTGENRIPFYSSPLFVPGYATRKIFSSCNDAHLLMPSHIDVEAVPKSTIATKKMF